MAASRRSALAHSENTAECASAAAFSFSVSAPGLLDVFAAHPLVHDLRGEASQRCLESSTHGRGCHSHQLRGDLASPLPPGHPGPSPAGNSKSTTATGALCSSLPLQSLGPLNNGSLSNAVQGAISLPAQSSAQILSTATQWHSDSECLSAVHNL